MRRIILRCIVLTTIIISGCVNHKKEQRVATIIPGEKWLDTRGNVLNAHGGGMLYYQNKYYWFGEHKSEHTHAALVGISCYASTDLYNWEYQGTALPVLTDTASEITKGCTMERPKVIYNEKTKNFVMFFHLELKGQGYSAARVGIATSKKVTGPYTFLKSFRSNANQWPLNLAPQHRTDTLVPQDFPEWWTNDWLKAVKNGLFVRRDFSTGQMSRDMTLFVDDNGRAYHIYASEENLTLHIAELNDDYTGYTGKYIRVVPGGHNEAPTLFKKDGRYFMITSGCTGWKPNAARLFTADSIFGTWTQHHNPCTGEGAEQTFHAQGSYVLPVQGKKDAFIFIADRWNPQRPIDGTYIWLPIVFEQGLPVIKWLDQWDLSIYESLQATPQTPVEKPGYKLIWNDEFNHVGKPDTTYWDYEQGFVRNQEDQWYQPGNAFCNHGTLNIVAQRETVKNPAFDTNSPDWRKNRPIAKYSSACLLTRGKVEFQYGSLEVRAKIPTAPGAWPAIWTLGTSMPWPSNGEIDIMECYRINQVPHILANTAWGTDKPYKAKWNSATVPLSEFVADDPLWTNKFHIWRMDWDEKSIQIYLDDKKLNESLLDSTLNGSVGKHTNPFQQPHYLLLNLAIGGQNGGEPDTAAFPLYYQIDYVRLYQKKL